MVFSSLIVLHLAGCASKPETVALSDGQFARVDVLIDNLERSKELHFRLAEAADKNGVFGAFETTGSAAYEASLDEAFELICVLRQTGHILGYHGDASDSVDADYQAGLWQGMDGTFLLINLDSETAIDGMESSVLLHEGLHERAHHGTAVRSETKNAVGTEYLTDEDFVDLVVDERDLPFLGSLIGTVVDHVLWRLPDEDAGREMIGVWEELGSSPVEIYNRLIAQPIMLDQDAWADITAEDLYDDVRFVGGLGITERDIADALRRDSVLYAQAHDSYVEFLEAYAP